MSAQDLLGLMQQLPPGADVFSAAQAYLDEQVYPDLGRAFYAQLWLAIEVLGFVIVCVVAALVIKASRHRLPIILQDGNCSRVDPKVAVPLCWAVGACLQIVFAFAFRNSVLNKSYSRFTGIMWLFAHLPLTVSYAWLSANVIAGAPPVRRYLSKSSHGAFKYNAGVAIAQAALIGSAMPFIVRYGNALHEIGQAYDAAARVIKQAKAAGSVQALFALEKPLLGLQQAQSHYFHATRIANMVYSIHIIIFLITGVIPALILGRMVQGKIRRLESSTQKDSFNGMTMSMNHVEELDTPMVAVELGDAYKSPQSDFTVPALPQDRPFAQLLEAKTTVFPQRFHAIMNAHGQSSAERAKRLRAVLARDLRMQIVYFGLLLAFLAMCMFYACDGLSSLSSIKQLLHLGYSWPTWNFGIPGLGMVILFMRDAITPQHDDLDTQQDLHIIGRNSRAFRPPPTDNAIQCSQVVSVAYAEEKDEISTPNSSKKFYMG